MKKLAVLLAAAPLLLDVPGETPLLPDTFRLADLGRPVKIMAGGLTG